MSSTSDVAANLRKRRGPLVAAWLFPVLCFVIGTLYLGGDLGKSTDDYAINLRDPVTNAVPSPFNPLARYWYFWRPLHNAMCFGVGTLWPEANRSVHVGVALMHGLACAGLFLLMRELTRTRLAPAAAALLFAVCPLHGEVAFWFCTTSTAIGSALFFAAALMTVRYARGRASHGALGGVFGLFFLVTCFYEQSAAPAAALPFIVLGTTAPGLGWSTRLARAMAATAAAGAACVLYVGLMIMTAPSYARGGAGSFVKGERIVERLHEFAWGVKNVLFAERASQIVRGSIEVGREALRSPPGLVAGATLLAGGVLWTVWATRRGGERRRRDDETRAVPGWLALAGIATFVAGWLPVYVIDRQIVELRNTYVPLLGLAMIVASLLDSVLTLGATHKTRARTIARLGTALATIAAAAFGIVALVGYQEFLRARWRQDQREIAELVRLVPNPPANTVFVPLRTSATATHTGRILFDRVRYGVFETPWSAHNAVVFAYRRNDIGATSYNPWLPPPRMPIDRPDSEGARWTKGLSASMTRLFPADPEGGLRVPWANMVPFVTESPSQGNELRLVRRLDAERADHRDLEVRPPLVHAAMDAARAAGKPCPTATYRFPVASTPTPELISIDFWEYGDGKPGQFLNVRPWGIDHKATWLAGDAGPRSTMSVQMPPLDRPENLLIRATIGEYDLDPARNPVARMQELVVTMGSVPEKELAVLRLDPLGFRAQKRWLPLVVKLPPRAAPAGDRIVVKVRVTDDPPMRTDPANKTPIPPGTRAAAPPVWVTHGFEESIPGP